MKTYQKYLTALLCASVLAACDSKSGNGNTPAAPRAPESEEGGISSGGGGTLPANPISAYEVNNVIADAKRDLRLYIRFEQRYSFERNSKFYSGERNLATQLEETDIEVLQDRPCKDKNGVDVDGSIYASRPNTICLSAFRIAPKLIKERAATEIEALILHELSHLLGANEAEAVEVQKNAANGLETIHRDELEKEMRFYFPDKLNEIQQPLLEIQNLKDFTTESSVLNDALAAEFKIRDIGSFKTEGFISAWDKPQDDFSAIQEFRFNLINLYMLGQFAGPEQASALAKYESEFQGHDELTVEQIEANEHRDLLKDNPYKTEKIQKIHNLQELKDQAKIISKYLDEQWILLEALAYRGTLPEMSGPWNENTPNPWIKFAGKYEVLNTTCTNDWDHDPGVGFKYTNIEITKMSESEALLKFSSPSYSGSDPIYRNANGYLKLTGDETFAQKTIEQGTRWYDPNSTTGWTQKLTSIKKDGDHFIYTERFNEAHAGPETMKTNYRQCVSELKKIN